MKKRLAGVLAALMVLVMGTTSVFAAGSPSAEDAVVDALNKGVTSVTTQNGALSIGTSKVSKEDYQAATSQKKNTYDSIVAMTDISGVGLASGQSISITIAVSGIRQGDDVYVLHKYQVGGTYLWEKLTPTAVGNGYVTVTMKSFSPVFVVKVGEAPSSGSSNSGSSTGSNTGSNTGSITTPPTTGDNNNNTTGDSTSQSNNNNQSNSQTNNQSNPVNVDQTVNVTYPDLDDRYGEGYEAGYNAALNANKGSSGSGGSGSSAGGTTTVVSPKTGASLPALPFVAMFAAAGIAVCGKKARKSNQ